MTEDLTRSQFTRWPVVLSIPMVKTMSTLNAALKSAVVNYVHHNVARLGVSSSQLCTSQIWQG